MRPFRKNRAALLTMLLALGLLASVSRSQQETSVTGRILAPDGKTPVPMAVVVLDDPAAPEIAEMDMTALMAGDGARTAGPPFYGVQEPEGEMHFGPPVRPGRWRVSVFSGRKLVPLPEPMEISVVEGETARIDITLPAASARRGKLVEEGTGIPVAGWVVGLVRPLMTEEGFRQLREPPEDFRVSMTDAEGAFWLFGDVSGEWSVFAGSASVGEPTMLGNMTLSEDPAAEVVVTLPAMPKTGGLVVDSAGQPVADTDIELCLVRQDGYSSGQTIKAHTGPDGTYSVRQLPRGTFDIYVLCDKGWAALGSQEVEGETGAEWRAELRPGGTVEVTTRRPTGEPVADQTVRVSYQGEVMAFSRMSEARSDGQGRATIAGLAPGTYDIGVGPTPGIRLLVGPRDRIEADLFLTDAPTVGNVQAPAAGGRGPAATEARAPVPPQRGVGPEAAVPAGPELRGMVQDANGQAVPGAEVYLDILAPPGIGQPAGPASTSDAGVFALSGVPAGYHVATVTLGGRPLACVPFYAAEPAQRAPLVIRLPHSDGTVRGRLSVGGTGASLPGTVVALFDSNQMPHAETGLDAWLFVDPQTGKLSFRRYPETLVMEALLPVARTGDDGAFVFEGVAPGRYSLKAMADGRMCYAQVLPTMVEPGASVDIGSVPVYSGEGLLLAGKLIAADGSPASVEGDQISLVSFSPGPFDAGPTQLGADGAFEIAVSRPGWYGLRIARPGAADPPFIGAVVRTDGQPSPVEVTVAAGEGTASVRIRVVQANGQPLAGSAWVVPLVERYRGGSEHRPLLSMLTRLGPDDACTIPGIPAGSYRFLCRADVDGRPDTTTFYGYTDLVALRPGEEREVVIASEQLAEVSGTVTDGNGGPAAGVTVTVSPSWERGRIPDARAITVTDTNGRFAVRGVEAGLWQVDSEGTSVEGASSVTAVPGETTEVTLGVARPAGEPPAEGDENTQQAGPVAADTGAAAGVVLRADGSPVPGAVVAAARSGMPWPPRRVTTDDQGRFSLPEVDRWGGEVIAWAPGYAESHVQIAFPDQAWRLQDQEGVMPAGEVTMTLARGSFVTGRVDLVPDDPAAGDLMVMALPKSQGYSNPDEDAPRALVAADGSFRLGPLAPGEWMLNAVWGRLPRSEPATVSLADGVDVTDVALTAPPLSSTLIGVATDVDGVTPIAGAAVSLRYGGLSLPVYDFTTDRNGVFTVHAIPPGKYSVSASISDQVTVDLPEVTAEPGVCEVLLARASARQVIGRVVPRPGRTLSAGLRAVLTNEGGRAFDFPFFTCPVAADGSYVLEAPSAGKFTAHVLYGRSTLIGRNTVEVPEQGSVRAPDVAP